MWKEFNHWSNPTNILVTFQDRKSFPSFPCDSRDYFRIRNSSLYRCLRMCVSNKVETKSISLQLINVRDSIHESNEKAIVEQRIKKKKEKKRKESLLFDRFPSTGCVIYIFVTVLSGLVDVTLYVLSEANVSCTMYIRIRWNRLEFKRDRQKKKSFASRLRCSMIF